MNDLLNEIARRGYHDDEGKLLTNSREFHELCRLVKENEKQKNGEARTASA